MKEGGEWHKIVTDLRKAVEKNILLHRDLTVQNNKEQEALRDSTQKITITIAIVLCLGVLAFGIGIARKMSGTVESVVISIGEVGSQLAGAIQQLTTAGQGLSEVTTESAASLEETVASLEELNSITLLFRKVLRK